MRYIKVFLHQKLSKKLSWLVSSSVLKSWAQQLTFDLCLSAICPNLSIDWKWSEDHRYHIITIGFAKLQLSNKKTVTDMWLISGRDQPLIEREKGCLLPTKIDKYWRRLTKIALILIFHVLPIMPLCNCTPGIPNVCLLLQDSVLITIPIRDCKKWDRYGWIQS